MNNVVTLIPGNKPVMAFDSEFKGRRYFHVRSMWFDDNRVLQPGKGLAVPYEQKDALLDALGALP